MQHITTFVHRHDQKQIPGAPFLRSFIAKKWDTTPSTSPFPCIAVGNPDVRRITCGLELFAKEADDMVGLHHPDHASLGIYHGKRVQIVFIEHLRQLDLLHSAGHEDARLG